MIGMTAKDSRLGLHRCAGASAPTLQKLGIVVTALTLISFGVVRAGEGEEAEQVEAISSKTSNGYVRLLRADGSFRPESYIFKKGEFWGGEFADPSMDGLTVDDVGRAVAPALARQRYFPAKDAGASELCIVVSWGTTMAPEHRSMDPSYETVEGAQMRASNPPAEHGAKVSLKSNDLGALPGVIFGLEQRSMDGSANTTSAGGIPPPIVLAQMESGRSTNGDYIYNPIIQASSQLQDENIFWGRIAHQNAEMLGYEKQSDLEVQRYRYFVVLMAYDNRTMSKKDPRLLWEARMSISEHRNLFNERVGALADNASVYFGQDSNGLVHKATPIGVVHIGQIRSLEFPTEEGRAAVAGDGAHMAYLKRQGFDNGLVVVDVDRPDGVIVSRIPSGDAPVRVVWSDPAHVSVTLASAETLSFDPGARSWSTASAGQAEAEHAGIPRQVEIQARVGAMFSHRTVSVVGCDRPGRRFLVLVSGAKGAGRYYIFDNEDEVLVDVGRSG
jgi:hypothetical protein